MAAPIDTPVYASTCPRDDSLSNPANPANPLAEIAKAGLKFHLFKMGKLQPWWLCPVQLEKRRGWCDLVQSQE
jgi:hypothetical protein